jgi:hypothetical protein
VKRRTAFLLFCLLVFAFWFPASGYAACTSPTGTAGNLIYDGNAHVPEYCNGVSWVVMAPTINLPPTNGLVGYWKLDDGSGTSALDSSANNNTGTLVNSPTWAAGYYNGALTFNGTTQYVSIPSSANYDSTTGTWAGWFKTAQTPASSFLIMGRHDASASENGITVVLLSSGALFATIKTNNVTSVMDISGGSGLNDGKWHHWAFTFNGTSPASLYLDGVQVNTVTPNSSWSFNSQSVRLGIPMDSYWGDFSGSLDDIRIYNRVLSAAEVATLHSYHISPPSSGLAGWWKFDESSGSAAADSSGNGLTGTLTGAPTWTAGGKINGALNFDGATQRVQIATAGTLSGAFTVSVWANPNGPIGSLDGLVGSRFGGDQSFDMKFNGSSALHGDIGNGTAWLTNGADASFNFSAGTWYQIAYVVTTSGYTIYVNGSQVAE